MPQFPAPDLEITHILVVADLDRARPWYRDVLGATVTAEYGGTSTCCASGRRGSSS